METQAIRMGPGPTPYEHRTSTYDARRRIADATTRLIEALADIKKDVRDHPTLLDPDRWDLAKEAAAQIDQMTETNDA